MSTSNHITIPNGYKRCSKGETCLTEGGPILPATPEYFGANKAEKDGVNRYCWLCHRANSRKSLSRWRKTHPEQHRANVKSYVKTDPKAQYRRNRKWVESHRDQARLLSRQGSQRRRARKRALTATFTRIHWRRALAYFGHRCAVCRASGKLAQDHWIPLVSGGTYTPDNIIPLCKTCNSSKHDSDPILWLNRKFPVLAAAIVTRVLTYFESLTV